MAEKRITLEELKPGDIVLFTPPPGKGSWESWLICFFTKSPVSHTGMVDTNPGYVLQEVPPHATRLPIPEADTRYLYVRRLEGEPDTSVVRDIAQHYVDTELPYPMSNLAFLGIYILASDFMPDTKTGKLMEMVLKIGSFAIMELINKHFHPGTEVPPMVCSQFAAACYDEAFMKYGPQYKINYNEKVSSISSLLHKMIDQVAEEEKEKLYEIQTEEASILDGAKIGIEMADLYCEQLAKSIQEQQSSNALQSSGKISDSLIAAFYQYGKGVLKLLGSKTEYPDKKQATAEEIKSLLQELLNVQDAFVSPGDLLSNSINLMDMGILRYTEDDRDKYVDPKDR